MSDGSLLAFILLQTICQFLRVSQAAPTVASPDIWLTALDNIGGLQLLFSPTTLLYLVVGSLFHLRHSESEAADGQLAKRHVPDL
jgi:hypothetical protein